MKITLTGASGFIGKRLVARLMDRQNSLHILGRHRPSSLSSSIGFSEWDANSGKNPPIEAFEGSGAVIHLAGEPVAQRWTPSVKDRILKSRVEGTMCLLQTIAQMKQKPQALVAASAIGYYGDRGEEILTEKSEPGRGFLAEVTRSWEAASAKATELGIRVAQLRTGVVLGMGGGALAKMMTPFRLGLGGSVAGGHQWMSWIHIDDAVGLMLAALDLPVHGPVNLTAPEPVRNEDFTKELARALHRPALLPVPEFGLKLIFGEMASMLTSSQRVDCAVAHQNRYRFAFPTLRQALSDLLP